jgi:hypothetical protein
LSVTRSRRTRASTPSSEMSFYKADSKNAVFLDYTRIKTPGNKYVTADYIIEHGLTEDVIDHLLEQIGCNLVGGLCILGFFLPSSVFSTKSALAIDAKIRERLPLFKASKEFHNEHTFVFFTNMKNLKIYSFRLADLSVINYPIIKFKEINEMISSVHLFVNRSYAISEETESDLEDASVQFDV